jgi:lipopolysaccharide biosynthesis regulator YciM
MCYVCGSDLAQERLTSESFTIPIPKAEDSDWQLTEDDIRKFEQKLTDATRKLRVNPKDPSLWMRRASILMELTRYNEAIKAYNRAINLDPNSIKAWSAKAYAANKIGDQKEAAICYKKAMELGMARSLDIDQLLHATDGSTSYREALDKAIGVLMTISPSSSTPTQTNQPKCPRCNSYKIKPHSDKKHKCHKCGHEFEIQSGQG